MAKNVNTKFVVGLSAALVILFGVVAGFAYLRYTKRDERFVAQADVLMARGDVRQATRLYERAVGLDQTRLDWLQKWKAALVQLVPGEVEYRREYDFLRGIQRRIALLTSSDLDAQIEYLDELERFTRASGSPRAGLENIIDESTSRSERFEPTSPEAARLLRYRGLARVTLMERTTLDEIQRRESRDDLASAVNTDQSDWEAKLGLVRWHLAESERYRRTGDDREMELEIETARTALDEFLVEFSSNPQGLLADYSLQRAQVFEDRDPDATTASLRAEIRGLASEVVSRMMSAPASALEPEAIERIALVLIASAGQSVSQEIVPLVDRTMEAHPGDARTMLVRAMVLQEAGRHDPAIEQLQRVVELPLPPTSLDGLILPTRQLTALGRQVDSALVRWSDTSLSADERASYLSRAEQYRDLLAREVDASTEHMLLLRDAKLELARNNVASAVRHLSDLRNHPQGQTTEAKRLLVQALEMQGNMGEALVIAEDLALNLPNSMWIHRKIGDLHRALGDFDRAMAAYQTCATLAPEDEGIAIRLAQVRTLLGEAEGVGEVDAVVRAILDARALRSEERYTEARELIENTIVEHPADPRLKRELLQIAIRSGRQEEALAIAQAECDADSTNTFMCQTAILLANRNEDDPAAALLALIEQEPGLTELDRALERYFVFVQFDRRDDAKAELDNAAAIDPDDARVIDYQFIMALGEGDVERARALTQRAASLNIDQVGGLKFQGRLQMAQGQLVEAIQTLESTVEQLPFDPDVRRLLGQAYKAAGRMSDAVAELRRAYEGRPDNPANAMEYARALLAANRGLEALSVVDPTTGALRHSPNNKQLLELWLLLEARFGDPQQAIQVRKDRRARGDRSVENTVSLVNLQMGVGDWQAAKQLVEAAEASGELEPSSVAMIRAEWLARQGDVDAGREALVAYHGTLGDEVSAGDYLTLGDFLVRHGQSELGVAAFRQGREIQNPEQMEADRHLGDYFFNLATRYDQEMRSARLRGDTESGQQFDVRRVESFSAAADHYQAILESTSDDRIIRRTAETLLHLDRLDEAETMIDQAVASDSNHKEVLGLQAALAERRGDRRLARQHLDQAIELYPTDPTLFLQRALFSRVDSAYMSDALQDFAEAVRLRPALVSAWLEWFKTLQSSGNLDDAFAVLRQGVQANAESDALRLLLLRELHEAGPSRTEEFQAEVLRISQEFGDSPRWMALVAKAMASIGRWRESAEAYDVLFDLQPTPDVAEEYLRVCLRPGISMPLQRIAAVLAVYEPSATNDLTDPQLSDEQRAQRIQEELRDQLLLARAKTALQELSTAKRHLMRALELTGNAGDAGAFFNEQLALALGSAGEVLEFLGEAKEDDDLVNMFLQAAEIFGRFRQGDDVSDLLLEAGDLEQAALAVGADARTLLEIRRSIAMMSVTDERDRQAADYYELALEHAPNDLQLNNDLAYLLLERLGEAEKGLGYAEKAAELAPGSSPVIDTLGWAYYKLGRLEDAERELLRAANLSGEPVSGIPAYSHLGIVQAALGKMDQARSSLRQAEQFCTVRPQTCENFRSDLEQLREACQ